MTSAGPAPGSRWRSRLTARPWTPSEALLAVLGAHLALVVGGSLVVGIGGWTADDRPFAADVAALVPFWVVAVLVSLRLARRDADGPARALALTSADGGPRRWATEVAGGAVAGVVTSVALVPVLYTVVHRLLGTDTADLERPARALVDRAGGGFGVVLVVVATAVAAPVVEELLYRGVLLPSLAGSGPALAVATTAVVFGVAHLQPLQFPGLVLIGVVLGVLRVLTDGLVAPIAAHVAFNATALVVLLTQH